MAWSLLPNILTPRANLLNTPLVIGHRGSSALCPENTIAAFRRAISDGTDGIEFDVRLAADNIPVVIHDATLTRTASLNARVASLTAIELQQIDVGRWFHRRAGTKPLSPSEETVPSLQEVFELFAVEARELYLEMKGEPMLDELPAQVARLTRAYNLTDRVVVESFDHHAIKQVTRLAPEIRTAALFERRISKPISLIQKRNIVGEAQRVRAAEIALHHSLVSDDLVKEARSAGFEVIVWTVDTPSWIERARTLGIKAVIANDPAAMLKFRDCLPE